MASQLTMWILYLTAAGLAVGMATTALLARRERWRWTVTEIVEKTAAEGPYRGWRAEERVHRARVPASVLAASVLGPVWGLAIGLALAILLAAAAAHSRRIASAG